MAVSRFLHVAAEYKLPISESNLLRSRADSATSRVDIPKKLAKKIEIFFATVLNIDDNIGRLDEFLQETRLKENTIVIFLFDKGGTGGYNTYDAGMRGIKTQLWEGDHRVPFFIRWPEGALGKPRAVEELATSQDILPTLIDLCFMKTPEDLELSGMSLDPLPKIIAVTRSAFGRPNGSFPGGRAVRAGTRRACCLVPPRAL